MKAFIVGIAAWLRGVAQLRHVSLVRLLGEMRQDAELLHEIRRNNPGAKIERGVVVKRWSFGQLILAPKSSVCHGTVLSCGKPDNGHGRISVGGGTWIGQYNNFRTCPDSDIAIGQDCLISQFCTLVSSNHGVEAGRPIKQQPMDTRRMGITIGDDVWLGAGVTVLPGVRIGNGVVVAANSVVTRDIPDNEIWAGSPAERKSVRT